MVRVGLELRLWLALRDGGQRDSRFHDARRSGPHRRRRFGLRGSHMRVGLQLRPRRNTHTGSRY